MNMGKYEFMSDELVKSARDLDAALKILFYVLKTDDEDYINVAGDYAAEKATEFLKGYKEEKGQA